MPQINSKINDDFLTVLLVATVMFRGTLCPQYRVGRFLKNFRKLNCFNRSCTEHRNSNNLGRIFFLRKT